MGQADDAAPGWDAITEAIEALYPGQKPEHWGTDISARAQFGGTEFLDGISAYQASAPNSHWHFVTYGLTELYDKANGSDPEYSGWGFELTLRAPRDEETAPTWPPNLLTAIARHISTAGFLPKHGGWFRAGRPLGQLNSDIAGFVFATDPDLATIDTAHGKVGFLQLVGLLEDELDYCAQHGGEAFLAGPGDALPKLLTIPTRRSLLAGPDD